VFQINSIKLEGSVLFYLLAELSDSFYYMFI